MKPLWDSDVPPEPYHITPAGWLRVLVRGSAMVLVVFGGLIILLLMRLIERPLWGDHRPVTPFITQFVCRATFVILGMQHKTTGQQMSQKGAIVANHSTWLDIFALNARKRIYFVAKSEVASWQGIGWLARATGTVFIRRHARDAKLQKTVFETRLRVGHKLLFFPEGTSTDGTCILSFKSTLFAAFFTKELVDILWIQPVTVIYTAPKGQPGRFYGWWGEMDFGSHFLKLLAVRRQGRVEIVYHTPLKISDFENRKLLAKACEDCVRSGAVRG